MKLQGNYDKKVLEIEFIADVYNESYEDGELDYIHTWDYSEKFTINNSIEGIVEAIKDFMENHLYYDWENLNGIEYFEGMNNIQSNMVVNEDNCELSKIEYAYFKNGKNFYSLNFDIVLKINDEKIDNRDLENVINEINKTFEK